MRFSDHNMTTHGEYIQTMGNKIQTIGETKDEVMVARPKVRLERPPMYKVVLLNDDYTPMDFVVKVLESIFRKEPEEAMQIMLEVHNKGAGICGVYTRDVAETKTDQTLYLARQHEHPLQCVLEKE
jgi:ATP-dependent Clp protease adaptor protein ClpS